MSFPSVQQSGCEVPTLVMCGAELPLSRTFHGLVLQHFKYEGHLESKERFAIQRYLLIIGKKQNMQVL